MRGGRLEIKAGRTLLAVAVAAAFAGAAGSALAKPDLASSVPSGGATVAAPAHLELHFSEAVDAHASRVHLDMTKLRIASGLVRHARKVDISVKADPADSKAMIVSPDEPLHSGVYRVTWRATSLDGHGQSGSFSFTVR